jgi:rSAM-associated Gly-rich repeat protein
MAQWNRLFKALSVVLPAGAFGASVVLALASADASAASNKSTSEQPASEESVSARLREIRSAISDMTGAASDESGDAKATPAWWANGGIGGLHLGWGNGGGGWGNGGGWRNGGWGNGWHNGGWGNGGGWRNGGWGNGGWHNGWHNFWHNW